MIGAERFSFALKDRDDIREPFHTALEKLPSDKTEFCVFTPSLATTEGETSPSLLVVGSQKWHLFNEYIPGETSHVSSDYSDILLVEMTVVLLLGRLKVDYAARGEVRTAVIEFNTVMEPFYHEAAQQLLDHMKGTAGGPPVKRDTDLEFMHSVPLKFRNSILRFMPPSEHVHSLIYWPAILVQRSGLIESELSPETALVLSDREILVVNEEKLIPEERAGHRFRIGLVNKHGSIAVHGLLSRLAEFRFGGVADSVTLDLIFRAGPAIEIITLTLPRELKGAVLDLLRAALRRKREES